MVLGSQSPVAELVSLRDFGRNAARTEPPSTLFHWSSDGEAVSDGTLKLTMREFRKLPEYFISRAEALCDSLMFGMKPDVDLSKIKDDMVSSESGYCFVEHPGNGLKSAYLDLLVQAYTSSKNGLARGGTWKWHAVVSYLKRVAEMEEQLAGGLHTACGQSPRVRELFSLECENGPSTTCGVYVWACYMVYVIRHHKAKRLTNREFYVVRFLPVRLGRVLYLYLVYIRKLANLLRREQVGHTESHQERTQTRLLFHSNGKAWPTSRLTGILTKATLEVWKQAVHVRLYRQLAVAVTEKHVREVYTPFNRYDDYSSDADVNVVFAWQSGHRPLQRGTTYGLDGAYPFRLQPPLLRAYEWASTRWHEFIHQASKKLSLSPQHALTTLESLTTCHKRTITDASLDSVSAIDQIYPSKRPRGWEIVGSLVERSSGSMPALELEDEGGEVLFPPDDESSHATPRLLERENPAWIDRVLCVLDEHQILICLLCKFAIGPGKSIVQHFRKMHRFKGDELQRVISFCSGRSFQDPTTVPLPNHQSKPIPELPRLRGHSCESCEYLTMNRKNILSHCSQLKHGAQQVGERGWKDVTIQTFAKGKYARYWIVEE
ncbi:hypothetical protein NW767_015667 [Fusarium falciforme]|nr:hypothetical protein NW767_015667 [Fusarium falciforme]